MLFQQAVMLKKDIGLNSKEKETPRKPGGIRGR
jgi:hypothetical protein